MCLFCTDIRWFGLCKQIWVREVAVLLGVHNVEVYVVFGT